MLVPDFDVRLKQLSEIDQPHVRTMLKQYLTGYVS